VTLRRTRPLIVVLARALFCASLGSLLFAAAPALASITHVYDSTRSAAFGSTPGAIGVALDQSTGSVYVAEDNSNSIHKFNAAGEAVESFGGGTGAISGIGYGPWHLAVDQTSHDIYASTEGYGAVFKFDSDGNLISSFGTAGQLSVQNPIGIGVDPTNGDLYVGSYSEGEVKVFTSSGSPVREFSTDQISSPLGVAVDASGRVYVAGGGFGGSGGLERFSASGTPQGTVQPGNFDDVAIDPGSEDVYATQGGEIVQYGPGAESVINVFGTGYIGTAWGVAVNEKTSEVYVGDYNGSRVDVFGPLVIVPDVTTEPPSPANVGHKSAELTGQIDPDGGPGVTECSVEYGVNTEYSSGKVPCQTSVPITTASQVSAELTGLTPLTTYHYRFVAKTENGTSYGQDQTVEPPAVLGISTNPATGETAIGAKLNGSFQVDSEGGDTEYYFEWGLAQSYGHKTPEANDSESGLQEVSADLTELNFYTLYHYRVVATNALGTSYGQDRTFRSTPPELPGIDSSSSSGVSEETATLEAEVNPNFGPTVVSFEYGPSISYGSRTPASEPIGEDGADHAVQRSITGLQAGVTYHYRVLAVNFGGRTTGPDQTFSTPDVPTVATTSASSIGQTVATLSAQITPGFIPTTYHFEYGTSTTYGHSTASSSLPGADNSAHPASADLTGLVAATTYHYRVVASNALGTAEGPDQTFTTGSQGEAKTGSAKCRKGSVLKHGKCVKKAHSKRKHRRGANNRGDRG
jgi:hypothetical protein